MLNIIKHVLAGGSCRSASSFLQDYVEGNLEPETARQFEQHIELCPNCKRYLHQYRDTISMVKEVPPPRVPPELEERTCEFIHQALGLKPKSDT